MRLAIIALGLTIVATGCATAPSTSVKPVAQATVMSADGSTLGTVDLVAKGDGYQLTGMLEGIAPGLHGIHLHAVGTCDGPEFTTAGGHLNPGLHQHGSMNPAGEHLGDLPNLAADSAGSARLGLDLRGTRADLDRDLFDSDGTALVVHASADDYKTDPSGNSGKRIGCGVLKRI